MPGEGQQASRTCGFQHRCFHFLKRSGQVHQVLEGAGAPRLRSQAAPFLPTTDHDSGVYSCSTTAPLQHHPRQHRPRRSLSCSRNFKGSSGATAQHHHGRQHLSCGDFDSINHGTAPFATTFATVAQLRAPATFRMYWCGSNHDQRRSRIIFAPSSSSHFCPSLYQFSFSDRDNDLISAAACLISNNSTSTTLAAVHLSTARAAATHVH